MNKNKLSPVLKSGFVFLGLLVLFATLIYLILPTNRNRIGKNQMVTSEKQESFSYVAIGDSLTQGVGDTTNQGGFVPLLTQMLEADYNLEVTSSNYGVAGNTSNQILKRMKEDNAIQKNLKSADLMTLTVGGNDVIHVLKDHITDLDVDTFSKPALSYQKRLRQIIEVARKDNKDLPIYIMGIYNPFYLNFPDMTEMQTVVDNWNRATESVTKEFDRVYFVPVNDLLYKGIDGQQGISDSSTEQADDDSTAKESHSSKPSSITNDALFEQDHFHPNNTGYQIISDAMLKRIAETKKEWSSE